jgi:hypothetical protein
MRCLTLVVSLLMVGVSGCASAPSPIDLTPRFVPGMSRVESLQTYAALRTPAVDVVAHVGFSWRAVVKTSGPEGATIEAQVTRVVVKLPGLPAFDTAGSMPANLLGVPELLFRMLDVRFRYSVSPTGRVAVSGWQEALEGAAGKVGCAIPADGSVPTERSIAEALGRVYRAPPRRAVSVDEVWSSSSQFHVGTAEQGSKVTATDKLVYDGFGELTVPFGDDDEQVHGLGIPIESTPAVVTPGEFFLGKVDAQTGRATGFLCMATNGNEVLGYWEKNELDVVPRDGLLPAGGGALLGAVIGAIADLEYGWAFFTASAWR